MAEKRIPIKNNEKMRVFDAIVNENDGSIIYEVKDQRGKLRINDKEVKRQIYEAQQKKLN